MDDRNDKSFLQTIAAFLAGFGIGKAMGQKQDKKKGHPILIAVIVIFLFLIIVPAPSSTPKKTYTKIQWPESELAELIPAPKLKAGYISYDSETLLDVDVKVSQKEFDTYVESCRERGFIVDYYHDSDSYRAYDEFGNYLTVFYDTKEKVMGIWLRKANEPELEDNTLSPSEEDLSAPESGNVFLPTETQVAAPRSSADCAYKNYQDIVSEFEQAGFTDIQTEPLDDLINGWLTNDGDVKSITIGELSSFSKDDLFEKDLPVVIIYHTFPEKNDEPSEIKAEVLTIENSEELANALSGESGWGSFARSHKGETIRFDGNISGVSFHSSYNPITGETKIYDTVFDVMVNAGDFDANGMEGPAFKFDGLSAVRIPSLDVGDNCMITAKVGSYNSDEGIWELSFVSMEAREKTGELTQSDIDKWIGKQPAN